jgi:hypothetical protein
MMDTLLRTVMAPLISKDCVAQKQTANSTAWEDLKLKCDGSLAPHVPCLTKIPDSLNHCSHIWDGFLGVMLRGTRAWVVFASVIYLCKNWKSPFKVQSLPDKHLSVRDLSVGPSKDQNLHLNITKGKSIVSFARPKSPSFQWLEVAFYVFFFLSNIYR